MAAEATDNKKAVLEDEREYETEADRELGEALTDAIEAAETAGEGKLAELLRHERDSHYYKSRLFDD
jgi:hypothetical protein